MRCEIMLRYYNIHIIDIGISPRPNQMKNKTQEGIMIAHGSCISLLGYLLSLRCQEAYFLLLASPINAPLRNKVLCTFPVVFFHHIPLLAISVPEHLDLITQLAGHVSNFSLHGATSNI